MADDGLEILLVNDSSKIVFMWVSSFLPLLVVVLYSKSCSYVARLSRSTAQEREKKSGFNFSSSSAAALLLLFSYSSATIPFEIISSK